MATTRSFSRSAEARNVTQSAFSRRIRSPELWFGAELLDHSTYPVSLTGDGRAFRESAEEIVPLSYQSRASLGGRTDALLPASIALTALHTLAFTFVPCWLSRLRESRGDLGSRILPENYALCVQALVEGGYDFLLTFHHPSVPVVRFQGFLTHGSRTCST
ncbi:LysR family transcriptional regulator (plasmid) [Paracoccus yeei]